MKDMDSASNLIVFLLLVLFYSSDCKGDISVVEKEIHSTTDLYGSDRVGSTLKTLAVNSTTCTDSSDDFPPFLDTDTRENGGFLLALVIGIYCFSFLAIICDGYFLPCVERICVVLDLSQDVAAATFMSVATSAPELFVNIIGTFITESDLGIGTIVGSSLFNALGVAALGGIAAAVPIKLDWWPLTRDVIIYIFAIFLLVSITWDGKIYWYEGLVLFIAYFVYFVAMFNNERISRVFRRLRKSNKVHISGRLEMCSVSVVAVDNNNVAGSGKVVMDTSRKSSCHGMNGSKLEVPCAPARKLSAYSHYGSYMEDAPRRFVDRAASLEDMEEGAASPWAFPWDGPWRRKAFFVYSWPIRVVAWLTVPDPVRRPNLFPLTFLMCILFIGLNSYIVTWMISVLGAVFAIPDFVLGLTFLAAGGCLPEGISITIMSRRGEGSMGVSNSLGANTMNILMSLGLPWFLKTISMGANDNAFIEIQSGSTEYTILSLIGVAAVLYITLYLNKFKLRKRVGFTLIPIYVVIVTLAIVSEMVFFKNAPDTCT